jgi:DNA-binding transcriptional ArsR family regulator
MSEINKKIVNFFSALSDETRLKILTLLMKQPKNVNEIYSNFNKDKITLSAISHQLKLLSNLDIIIADKIGREKTYKLSDRFCWCVLRDALKHFN